MKIIKIILVTSLFFFSAVAVAQNSHEASGLKKVVVQEVLQIEAYTYLKVLEDSAIKWLAISKMEVKTGEIYYYKGGLEMPNFKSVELDRTFDMVVFLESITRADAIDAGKGLVDQTKIQDPLKYGKKPTLDKLELTIEGVEGGIHIADLLENKQIFSAKKIKIKGEVTKFSSGIMGKNWVHFQDGTSFEGAYDLMITSQENVMVGDVVVFEGVIMLDKDFGAGYFYKVIMEDAVILP